MKAIEKAQAEIQAGRLWRAKEILRGAIGQQPYDCSLYREYGKLLLQLGDLPEAGKYLLLAGSRETHHEEAIAVFLARWGKNEPSFLYSRFPVRARLASVSDYPKRVREVLTDRFKPTRYMIGEPTEEPKRRGCWEAVALWGCGLVVFLVIILLMLGVKELVDLTKSI